jgi:kynurenine formamidase
MKLIDLTFEPGLKPAGDFNAGEYRMNLESPGIKYTGVCYNFEMNSMAGTYIDFPGHIAETDDGQDAKKYPLEKLYRRTAKVIHLDRTVGAVSAKDLEDNCSCKLNKGDALIINVLGYLQFHEVEERSVYLDKSAVDWIIEQGIELLISDIYESTELIGVFYYLFEAGISTVCYPVNLDKLTAPEVKITILPLPVEGVVQIPCRMVAELK